MGIFKGRRFKSLPFVSAVESAWEIPVFSTVLNRASVSAIQAAPARTLSVALSADQNNWSPTGLSSADILQITVDGGAWPYSFRTITGIAAQPDGTTIVLQNSPDSTAGFVVSTSDSRSSAANRAYLGVLPAVITLPGESIEITYNSVVGGWTLGRPPFFTESWNRERLEHSFNDGAWPGLQTSVSGTGAAVSRVIAGGDIGQANLATGTTTSGRAGIGSTSLTMIATYGGVSLFQGGVFTDPVSDGTNRYTVRVGCLDSLSAEPNNGAYLKYADNNNGGKWEAICADNGVRTTGDTGLTHASTFTPYCAILVYINQKYADFYIGNNKTMAWAVRVSGVGNLGDGSNRAYGYGASIIKSLGTTSRSVACLPFRFIYHAAN